MGLRPKPVNQRAARRQIRVLLLLPEQPCVGVRERLQPLGNVVPFRRLPKFRLAGLVESTARGVFRITDRGKEALRANQT